MAGGIVTFRPDALEVRAVGSTNWQEVPGVGTISKSGGEGSQTQIEAIDGVASITSPPGVPTIGVTLASYVPTHPSIQLIESSANSATQVEYRLTTQDEQEILPANADSAVVGISVTTAGVATIAGTGTLPAMSDDAKYNVGLHLEIGGTTYTIDKINSNTEIVLDPAPGTAVATSAFEVNRPALREQGIAEVQAAGNYEGGVGAAISGGFTLAPIARNALRAV